MSRYTQHLERVHGYERVHGQHRADNTLSARDGGRGISPPFARTERDIYRRSPLGLVEEGTGNAFFTLPAGGTSTMKGKVSRPYHGDRLLIVPSAPGVVITSIKVGDEEQMASPNAPVELYSEAALTDELPDNFSPVSSGVDFSITLLNTTVAEITGTAGLKGGVHR